MLSRPFDRASPEELADLADLALDLRWMGSPLAGRISERLDAEAWERTKNPYILLTAPQARLEEAARDEQIKGQLCDWVERRKRSTESAGWFRTTHLINP